jgi:hypothetical protein
MKKRPASAELDVDSEHGPKRKTQFSKTPLQLAVQNGSVPKARRPYALFLQDSMNYVACVGLRERERDNTG